MQEELSAKKLSEVLYEIDPGRTSCKENEMYDEYDNIAHYILETIDSSTFLKEAIEIVLFEFMLLEKDEYNVKEILDKL